MPFSTIKKMNIKTSRIFLKPLFFIRSIIFIRFIFRSRALTNLDGQHVTMIPFPVTIDKKDLELGSKYQTTGKNYEWM